MFSGGVWDTDGLDEDLQELSRNRDDGAVEVHRWINDVQWNAFQGSAKVCSDSDLQKNAIFNKESNYPNLAEGVDRCRSKQSEYEEHYVDKHAMPDACCK